MLDLAPNETILRVMRRHWIVFAGPSSVFVLLLILPSIFFTLAPRYFPVLQSPLFRSVAHFGLALYFMALLIYIFTLWLIYYLDIWVVTNQRVIDIEQLGIFRRRVSEIPLERVENVTVEIPGLVATALGFGNVRIQTAGEGEFTISQVTDFYQVQSLILSYIQRPRSTAVA